MMDLMAELLPTNNANSNALPRIRVARTMALFQGHV
jgi:hypothetical protein